MEDTKENNVNVWSILVPLILVLIALYLFTNTQFLKSMSV